MIPERFRVVTTSYARLRVAVVGDFCLDRYLEIDPAKRERSLETGRPVHNVVRVRAQAGGAGTIVNNLSALGVSQIYAVGFVGPDGEGFELRRALGALPGVQLEHFLVTDTRCTFTYTKPLLIHPNQPPEELDRLDHKNWTATPYELEQSLIAAIEFLMPMVDAVIVLDQVDVAETGVITAAVRDTLAELTQRRPDRPIIADSRRGLRDWPPLVFKMNRAELAALIGDTEVRTIDQVRQAARRLAVQHGKSVFVTLAEEGLVGASPNGDTAYNPAHPLRGPIDIVGAGDAVTANLAAALAAGADLWEAMSLASAAASIVIHKLGTTGTASVAELEQLLYARLRG